MNWVGGSRNRVVMKNDAKRQREFFERRKMQQKLKNLGIALPASPGGTSSGSMDLVTLFIVNQIAAKKENKDRPKVAVLGSCKGGPKHKRSEPLVLPMSPCSPSQLRLVESQPQYSVPGAIKRKQVIPQGFKCQQLSPVLESAFSDNSASDYLPPMTDILSPLSYTSSASSGRVNLGQINLVSSGRGRVQAQLRPCCSPPPWYTSGLVQTKFQPFSQPRCMTDSIPWSCGSNPPLYQLEKPSAARVTFGNPEPDSTDARDHAGREVTFCLDQPEGREPVLDFTFNQPETGLQFEDDVFRGFSTEERERGASHLGRGKSKIYLKDGTPVKPARPQTVPDSQCELSNCTDTDFSCLEHNSGPMNGCDCSPSYSCRRGCLSSDSNDDEEHCGPCLQAGSPYMDQACCADNLNPNPGPDKALGSHSQQTGSNTAQFASPHALAHAQSSELCKCEKTSGETRDAGTQTAGNPAAETCDASTQCSFVVDGGATKATGFNLSIVPVDVSVQHPATGRQTDTAAEPHTHTHLHRSGETRSGGKHTPRSNNKSKAGSLSGSDGKVILKSPIKPLSRCSEH